MPIDPDRSPGGARDGRTGRVAPGPWSGRAAPGGGEGGAPTACLGSAHFWFTAGVGGPTPARGGSSQCGHIQYQGCAPDCWGCCGEGRGSRVLSPPAGLLSPQARAGRLSLDAAGTGPGPPGAQGQAREPPPPPAMLLTAEGTVPAPLHRPWPGQESGQFRRAALAPPSPADPSPGPSPHPAISRAREFVKTWALGGPGGAAQ